MYKLCICGFFGVAIMSTLAVADCCIKPNPYLKRSIADNLLLEIKSARDDGKNAADILSELKKKVALITRLAIKKNMFGQTIVELSLEQPWVQLICEGQTPRALARSGATMAACLLRDDVLRNMATVFIDKKSDTPDQTALLAHWLKMQSPIFFSRFSVYWHDKNDIEVRDEQLENAIVRASHKTIFNHKIVEFLDKIKEKERQYAFIDLRFGEQQIVLVPKDLRGKLV